jgi:hypothetical protein
MAFSQVKFTELPNGVALNGAEIFAVVQSGVSVQTTTQAIAEFVGDLSFNYGAGIAYDAGTNTISADINTTNLQFTVDQINTIQDIDLTASPTFTGLTLSGLTNSSLTGTDGSNNIISGDLSGDLTTSAFVATLATVNGDVGTWGDQLNVPQFVVNEKGLITSVTNIPIDIPEEVTAFGEAFFQDNLLETVISLPNVPVKINAVYNTGELLDFTQAAGTLTYIGDTNNTFSVNLSLTTAINLDEANISVSIFLNGVAVPKSTQSTFTGSTTPGLQSTSVNALINLSTNDTIEVFVTNLSGTENILVQDLNINVSTVGGKAGNLDQVVIAWDGSTAPVSVFAGTDIDITGGTISYVGTSGDNVVTSWDGSTSPVGVTAGADIDITGGVISYTGGGGSGGLSGNFELGVATVPQDTYSDASFISIIDQIDGTQTVAANSLSVGESVQVKCTFELIPTIPTAPSVAGAFQFVFGSTVITLPNNIILTNSATRSGFLEFTVTRINLTEVNIDVTGWFNQTSPVDMSAIVPSQDLLGQTVWPYDPNIAALIDVRWQYTGGSFPTNFLDFIGQNIRITQFTSRQAAGGNQVVDSWNGSTAPVDVVAGTNMDITSGVISTTADENVVTAWNGSSSPVAVTAGTGINIAGGVITNTVAASGNPAFFKTLIPNDNYDGTFKSMWATSLGSATIDPFTFLLGETIVIDIVGEVNAIFTNPNVTVGSFMQLTFGPAFTQISNDLDPTLEQSGITPWSMRIKITRANDSPDLLIASGVGTYFEDNALNPRPVFFNFPGGLISYDESLPHTINLEYRNGNSAGNTYDFIAKNLYMTKYS